jgi:hypothetical protein
MPNFSEAEFLKSANSIEVLGLSEMEKILSRTGRYQTLGIFSGETGGILVAEHYQKSPDQISEEKLRQYFLYVKNVKKWSRLERNGGE